MLMTGWQLLQTFCLSWSHPSDIPDLQLSVHEVLPFCKSESLGVIVIKLHLKFDKELVLYL